MPISYEIDEQAQVIHELWSGEIDARDLEVYWTAYLRDPRVLAIRRTLVDVRSSIIHFNGDDLARLIERIVVPAIGNAKWKTALIVERPLQFGVSRQYQALAELYSQDAIFHDRDKALAWLLEQ